MIRDHVSTALMTLVVGLLAILLGALVGVRRPSVALAAGWGIAVIVLTLGGTLTGIGLTRFLAGLGILAFCGIFRWHRLHWRYALPVLVLGIPYLLIASWPEVTKRPAL